MIVNNYEIIACLLTAFGILISIALSLLGFFSKKERDLIIDNVNDIGRLEKMITENRNAINFISRDISTLNERSTNDKELIKKIEIKIDRILERLK